MTKKNFLLLSGIILIGLAVYFGLDRYDQHQFQHAYIKGYKYIIFAAIMGVYCIYKSFSKPKNKEISQPE